MKKERRRELAGRVIEELAKMFSIKHQKEVDPIRDYLGDSWLANMHLIYANEYLSFRTFYSNEVEDKLSQLCGDNFEEWDWCETIVKNLEDLMRSASLVLSKLDYGEVGSLLEVLIVLNCK
jgi:hypothetical protein